MSLRARGSGLLCSAPAARRFWLPGWEGAARDRWAAGAPGVAESHTSQLLPREVLGSLRTQDPPGQAGHLKRATLGWFVLRPE